MSDIDQLCINTIRTLSIDAIQKANSGHPGAPMGMAAPTYDLWTERLRYDPKNPLWPNRDRFILSAGHASMLLYSMLHLCKVEAVDHDGKKVNHLAVSMDDVKSFRQAGSYTPGHPEYGMTTGVEATTGPARPGHRDERRHGHRREVGSRPTTTSPTLRSSTTISTPSVRTAR